MPGNTYTPRAYAADVSSHVAYLRREYGPSVRTGLAVSALSLAAAFPVQIAEGSAAAYTAPTFSPDDAADFLDSRDIHNARYQGRDLMPAADTGCRIGDAVAYTFETVGQSVVVCHSPLKEVPFLTAQSMAVRDTIATGTPVGGR